MVIKARPIGATGSPGKGVPLRFHKAMAGIVNGALPIATANWALRVTFGDGVKLIHD
jgi:hypothetical protein